MTKTQVQAATFLINKVMPNPPEERHLSGSFEVIWPLQQSKLEQ